MSADEQGLIISMCTTDGARTCTQTGGKSQREGDQRAAAGVMDVAVMEQFQSISCTLIHNHQFAVPTVHLLKPQNSL